MKKILLVSALLLISNFLIGQPFERKLTFRFDHNPSAFTYGDLDGNGYEDLVTSFENKKYFSIVTNSATGSQLPVTIPIGTETSQTFLLVADINSDTRKDIIFTDPGRSRIGLLLNKGNLEFEVVLFFNVSGQPAKIVSADFNNDGINDLAVLSKGSNNISLLYANQANIFSPALSMPTNISPVDIEVSNFSNDSFVDLLVAHEGDSTIAFFTGGAQGFQKTSQLKLNMKPANLQAKDIDGNGFIDLAVVFASQNKVQVLFGTLNNTYSAPKQFTVNETLSAIDFVIDDFNDDNIEDMAIASGNNSKKILFLLGKGSQDFDIISSTYNSLGTNTFLSLSYTDLSQQGKKGFLTGNRSANKIFESYPTLTGSPAEYFQFNAIREFTIWADLKRADLGDINKDGLTDIVLAGNSLNFVAVYFQNSNSTFDFQYNLPSGIITNDVQLTDLNNDTFLDLVTVGVNESVFINNGSGQLQKLAMPPVVLSGDDDLLLGDFNKDGLKDIVFGNVLFLNGPANQFVAGRNFGDNISGMAALDYNNDGNLDVAVSQPFLGEIKIYPGNGDGTFGNHILLLYAAYDLDAADLNNDGFDDLIASNFVNDKGKIFFGAAQNAFDTTSPEFSTTAFSSELTILDIDRNNQLDIVFNDAVQVSYYPVSTNGQLGTLTVLQDAGAGTTEIFSTNFNGNLSTDIGIASADQLIVFTDKMTAQINFNDLQRIYNGATVTNIVSTIPENLSVNLLFNGVQNTPRNAGTYSLMATITDANYKGSAEETLNISKAALTITAQNQTRLYGQANGSAVLTYNGFKASDEASSLDQLPLIDIQANALSPVGTYGIMLSGGLDNNYEYTLVNGELSVGKALLTVSANDIEIGEDEEIPQPTYTISGFVNGENQSVINVLPEIAIEGLIGTTPGEYAIVVGGGSDDNYSFEYQSGTLVINVVANAEVSDMLQSRAYPNPASHMLKINNQDMSITSVSMLASTGERVYTDDNIGNSPELIIDITSMKPGLYLLNVVTRNARTETVKVMIR